MTSMTSDPPAASLTTREAVDQVLRWPPLERTALLRAILDMSPPGPLAEDANAAPLLNHFRGLSYPERLEAFGVERDKVDLDRGRRPPIPAADADRRDNSADRQGSDDASEPDDDAAHHVQQEVVCLAARPPPRRDATAVPKPESWTAMISFRVRWGGGA